MIDYDELRKAIAMEHNTLVGKDDPILMIPTINEAVLERALEVLNERNAVMLKAIEVSQQKAIADAKLTASKIITEASDYVSEQVNTAVTAALEEGIARLQLAHATKEFDSSRRGLIASVAVTVLCIIALIVTNVF